MVFTIGFGAFTDGAITFFKSQNHETFCTWPLACLPAAGSCIGGRQAQHRDAGRTIEGWAVDSHRRRGIAFATVQASGEGAKSWAARFAGSAGFFRVENVPSRGDHGDDTSSRLYAADNFASFR